MSSPPVPDVQSMTIHGHRRAFVRVGCGPPWCSSTDRQTTDLDPRCARSRHFTVIAPDLLGHGAV